MRDCPVDGCTARISSELAMCRAHWRKVPKELQTRVWRAWRHYLKRRTEEALDAHQAVLREAVELVNEAEDRQERLL